MSKTYSNFNVIESTKVRVFPCAYRGTDGEGKLFNPEARLNTEHNFTLPQALGQKSYLLSWKENNYNFVICGYNFEIKEEDLSALGAPLYAYIKLVDFVLPDNNNLTTKCLSDVSTSADSNDSLDIKLDDDYYFCGLGFTNAIINNLTDEYSYLQLLDGNGNINKDSFWVLPERPASSTVRLANTEELQRKADGSLAWVPSAVSANNASLIFVGRTTPGVTVFTANDDTDKNVQLEAAIGTNHSEETPSVSIDVTAATPNKIIFTFNNIKGEKGDGLALKANPAGCENPGDGFIGTGNEPITLISGTEILAVSGRLYILNEIINGTKRFIDAGNIKGEKGDDGVGIESIEVTAPTPANRSGGTSTITIRYTDGSTPTAFYVYNGRDGANGQDGEDGSPRFEGNGTSIDSSDRINIKLQNNSGLTVNASGLKIDYPVPQPTTPGLVLTSKTSGISWESPQGTTYTAGDGITINGKTISVDTVITHLERVYASSTISAGLLLSGKEVNAGISGITSYGPINASGQTVTAAYFDASSDRRLKENIKNYSPEKSILDLPIYKYDFIDGKKDQIGCIAQDLQEICPEIVDENKDGYLSIQESKLVYLLLDEVKKLKKEIEELKK